MEGQGTYPGAGRAAPATALKSCDVHAGLAATLRMAHIHFLQQLDPGPTTQPSYVLGLTMKASLEGHENSSSPINGVGGGWVSTEAMATTVLRPELRRSLLTACLHLTPLPPIRNCFYVCEIHVP